jgi:hypothetical protein
MRDTFAPEPQEHWGTAPDLPGAPLVRRGEDDSQPDPPDTEPGPFTPIGIGADRVPLPDGGKPDRRTR